MNHTDHVVKFLRKSHERKGLVCQVHPDGHDDNPPERCLWIHESVLVDD
jgi:hypothetical protein